MYNFLYYCFSTIIWEKGGGSVSERTSFIFATIQSLYAFALFLLTLNLSDFVLNKSNGFFIAILVFAFITGFSYLMDWYFSKTGRHDAIIKKYSYLSKGKKTMCRFLVIVLILGAFAAVPSAGISYSKNLDKMRR